MIDGTKPMRLELPLRPGTAHDPDMKVWVEAATSVTFHKTGLK